jgi:hemerythrin
MPTARASALTWDPGLSIGVGEIDEQHRELFRRAAALVDTLEGARAAEELAGTLGFLAAYVREHFAAEEALMLRRRYPGLAAHQEQHRGFTGDLARFLDEFRADGPSPELRGRLESFLGSWLRDHIAGTDRRLAEWLRAAPPEA